MSNHARIWLNELWRGKSFGRAKLNEMLAQRLQESGGKWLDIGAGAGASYKRFLPAGMEHVPTDLFAHPGVLALDANLPFPFEDNSFDGCLALNMLYTLDSPTDALKEILRVVKPGGRLFATFPFFFPENPEPRDYFRWTREGVEKTLAETGWKSLAVEPVGASGTVFGTTMLPLRGNKLVNLCAMPFVAVADRLDKRSRITYIWLATAIKPIL